MLLSDLIGNAPNVRVEHITCDSRTVQRGGVFVVDSAEAGLENAQRYIAHAIEQGAAFIICDAACAGFCEGVAAHVAEHPKKAFAKWAKAQCPRQPRYVVGVTGTNGKTSVAWFFNQLLTACGKKAASIGTLGTYVGGNYRGYSGYTSPTADVLHQELQTLADGGVDYVCMEVSSHALATHRVDEVAFSAAALTNITQDHLDFHGSFDQYALAKYRLFNELLPQNGVGVLNPNRMEALPLAHALREAGQPVMTIGAGQAQLVVRVEESSAAGLQLLVKWDAIEERIFVPLVGAFQAENVAHALALALACDVPFKKLMQALPTLASALGRMEMITAAGLPTVVVDYAHTPDALKTAMQAVRPQVAEGCKLWTIFGCGGDRDTTKRAPMGQFVQALSDVAIITDDNPRTENAENIRAEIYAACPKAEVIGDRKEAIRHALTQAQVGDIILLAGKGHEDGQIIGREVHSFDDRTVTRALMEELS